jgi:hypothetical protein
MGVSQSGLAASQLPRPVAHSYSHTPALQRTVVFAASAHESQLPQCAVWLRESLHPSSESGEQWPKPGRHEPSPYTQRPSRQPIASGTTFGSNVQS